VHANVELGDNSYMMRQRFWALAALFVCIVLAGGLAWSSRQKRTRRSVLFTGDPQRGSELFHGKKLCARCHAVNGQGSSFAPDLGARGDSQASLSQLVVAMWNHAPRMLEKLQSEGIQAPEMSYQEMADILVFLYTQRAVDTHGDPEAGRRVFEEKNCARCHPMGGPSGRLEPEAAFARTNTPMLWAEAAWNHASWMDWSLRASNLERPKFQGHQMTDLFAFVRQAYGTNVREDLLFPASPERGWKVFQASCIACHSIAGKGGTVGPPLGPGQQTEFGLAGFAGIMWNHSPELWLRSEARGIPRPGLSSQDMADLVTLLYSLRYFEPRGSPTAGKGLFAARGCAACHGPAAMGTSHGPRLRGRGESFSTVRLATTLWQHGAGMVRRVKDLHVAWPTIAETDVGDLIEFLNSPLEETNSDRKK